jgi:tRNA-dihydrouridine synthase
MRLGNFEIENPLILGPMAGVTDWAFRTVCCIRSKTGLPKMSVKYGYITLISGSKKHANGRPIIIAIIISFEH